MVEAKAKEFPNGPFRRMLVEVYRDQKDYARSESLLDELCKESPDDSSLAVALVFVLALDAADAAASNQLDREREINDKAAALIREYRSRFPKDVAFVQAECDLVARRGDFARAIEMTREDRQDFPRFAEGSDLEVPFVRGSQSSRRTSPKPIRMLSSAALASSTCECCLARPSSSWERPTRHFGMRGSSSKSDKNRPGRRSARGSRAG